MADPNKRLSKNVDGTFFVDASCINCDTCRQLSPHVFGEASGYSYVKKQPEDAVEEADTTLALLSCPTASIGAAAGDYPRLYISRLPMPLARDVYYCGFNSRRSYGANSYFITAGEGNWLIDSPRFVSHLVTRFREMGGLRYIFLTHQDDVADAAKYAAEFGAKMIIHEADADAMPSAHIKVSGTADCHYADNITVIPTPGHTRGHCVLLFRDEYLFTGDHLAWDREQQKLEAFDDFCWYSWEEQKQSLAKLLNYNFRFVLSGHGQRHNFADTAEAHSALRTLVEQL